MEKAPKHLKEAIAWGKAHGYGIVDFVTSEDCGEIFHLADKSFIGRKTGLPRFLLIEADGTAHFSTDWDIKEINRLSALYLQTGSGPPLLQALCIASRCADPTEYLGSSQDNRLPMPLQGILPRSWFVLSEY